MEKIPMSAARHWVSKLVIVNAVTKLLCHSFQTPQFVVIYEQLEHYFTPG